jgi:glycosyltransferase involved in cell wall biosynthesis
MSVPGRPLLSVVIPARNAERHIAACLSAVGRSAHGQAEVIVVDDGSGDRTGEMARAAGATVATLAPSGPARARNEGARRATSEIVLFVDADVVIADDAIPRVLLAFADDPGLAGVFGSYDSAPSGGTIVSDYRNLLHHFVHQSAEEKSGSFWAGCGAVRRSVLLSVGGFDERYERPSIEDIELGARLARAGHRVRLDKRLMGRHTKRWTLDALVLVDVRDRAYPWARLLLRERRMPSDLNLRPAHRASGVFVWLALGSVAGLLAGHAEAAIVLGSALAALVWLNRRFYRFLTALRGLRFTVAAFFLHAFYYAYASAAFGWAWVCHHIAEMRGFVRRFDRRGAAPGASS